MISTLKKINRVLDFRQKKRILVLFILTIISAFLEMLGVTLMIPMISAIMTPDIIERNQYVAFVCKVLDLHSHRTFVIVCIIALILVFVVKNVFLMFQYYVQTRFVCDNRFLTQQRLLRAYFCKPYEYYLNASTAEIMRVIHGDAGDVYSMLTTLLFMCSEIIVSFALVITIFIIDPLMTSFVAIMMIIIVIIISKGVKPVLVREGKERQVKSSEVNKWLFQAVDGIKAVKVSRKESFFEANYREAGYKLIHAEKINTTIQNTPRLLIEMVSICSMLALIAIEIYFGRDIESLVPTLSAFAMAAVKLMPSANRIVGAINTVNFYMPALDKLIEHLDDMEDVNGLTLPCDRKPRCDNFVIHEKVELKKIVYHYPNSENLVLNDTGMEIPVGKTVGIVGTSGSGKTTAVDIMLGLLTPQLGKVLADGNDIMDDYEGWLSHIGYIPQMIFMLDDSIRSNVAFGSDQNDIDEERVLTALREAQLDEFVKGLPDGLNTTIGEKGVRISGGQRQRIGIARALYADPDLLLFDEATSALDNETESAIMESINSLHGKKTMVIIAHRLQTIEGCDMVYRVQDGKIVRER